MVRKQPELVQIIEGDVMLSVLTSDPVSALFVINRVNQANLISADFEVGKQSEHKSSYKRHKVTNSLYQASAL